MTIWRRLAFVAVAAMTVSSCAYLQAATDAETSGGPVPWWCTSTEEIPVTDRPRGRVRSTGTPARTRKFSRGIHSKPRWQDRSTSPGTTPCNGQPPAGAGRGRRLGEGDEPTSRAWARTTSAAASHPRCSRTIRSTARTRSSTASVSTTSSSRGKPEVLQYDSNGPDGQARWLRLLRPHQPPGCRPEGFAGNNDWWHHHPWICYRTTDAAMIGFNFKTTRRAHRAAASTSTWRTTTCCTCGCSTT